MAGTRHGRQAYSQPPKSGAAIDDLAASLETEKARASLDLLEAIYAEADVKQTVPLSVNAGASKSLFEDDSQILFLAAEVAAPRNLSRFALASFARAALRTFGYWDDAQILGNYGSALWSDVTLAALFEAMFFSPCAIEHRVKRLILLHRRERAAREHLEHAQRLLAGEIAA
jgi:hypothetical protein